LAAAFESPWITGMFGPSLRWDSPILRFLRVVSQPPPEASLGRGQTSSGPPQRRVGTPSARRGTGSLDAPVLGMSPPAGLPRLADLYSGSRCSSRRHQDRFRFDGLGLEILMQHEYITRSLLVGSTSVTEWSIRRCHLLNRTDPQSSSSFIRHGSSGRRRASRMRRPGRRVTR
jgi:hypothetical protein